METLLRTITTPLGEDIDKSLTTLHDTLTRQQGTMQDEARAYHNHRVQGPQSPLLELIGRAPPATVTLVASHLLANEAAAQASVAAGAPADERLFESARALLLSADARQAQIAARPFSGVCHTLTAAAIAGRRAQDAIKPLWIAAERVCPSEGCLTAVDADLLECCIHAKCYHIGMRWLDARPVYMVAPKKTAVTPHHLMRYFYYAGVVCVGEKRWHEALDFFHMAVTTPAQHLSALAVESRKKAVLVSLLLLGEAPPLPQYAPSIMRTLSSHLTKYKGIADAFESDDMGAAAAAVEAAREALTADGNLGLAKQAAAARAGRKVSQLTQAYVTLSLQDIAAKVGLSGPAEAEQHLLRMVELRQVQACIEHHPDGSATVNFTEETEDEATAENLAKLQAELSSTLALADRVRAVDAALAVDPAYLSHVSDPAASAAMGPSDREAAAIGLGGGWGDAVEGVPPYLT